MPCNSCGSMYLAEVDIHFPGPRNAGECPDLVPKLLVCFDCGKTEFMVPKAELDILTNSDTTKLPIWIGSPSKAEGSVNDCTHVRLYLAKTSYTCKMNDLGQS